MWLLLSLEEIMLRSAQGKMLVLPQGSRPIVSDRVAYWQDQVLDGLWDAPRGPVGENDSVFEVQPFS